MRQLHLLIVEDRQIIAAKIRRTLLDAGYAMLDLAPTIEAAALQVRHAEQLDAAILDIDLRGKPVYPVAELLEARRIPFIFLTGRRLGHRRRLALGAPGREAVRNCRAASRSRRCHSWHRTA